MSKAEVLFDQTTTKSVAMFGAMMKGKKKFSMINSLPVSLS